MPRMTPFGRRAGPVGVALTAWDIWRRLPPRQRKQVLDLARAYGPKMAAGAVRAAASYRGRRPPPRK